MTTPPLDWRLNAFRDDLADERLRGVVKAAAYVTPSPARLAAPSAPLLRRPDPAAPMDSQLLHGETVDVFDRRDGWAWVQNRFDGYVGYVAETALSAHLLPPTHWVRAGQTVVLSDADQIAAPLHTLSLGAQVTVAEPGGRFHRLADGGYIFAGHLADIGRQETDWVAVAERLLGLPYLWGGRGHGGIDCSGLVQMALAACGKAVLRDSDQQAGSAGEGIGLNPGNWQRGDLVYLPGHVVIVRDASTVVHATGFRWSVIVENTAESLARMADRGYAVHTVRRP